MKFGAMAMLLFMIYLDLINILMKEFLMQLLKYVKNILLKLELQLKVIEVLVKVILSIGYGKK